MKYLWWLLPLITLWVCFGLGYLFIDNHPFEHWWSYPFVLTLIIAFLGSFVFAIIRIKD